MKKENQIKIIVLFIVIAISCTSEKGEKKQEQSKHQNEVVKVDCQKHIFNNKRNNLNISVFLDLSDRIEESSTVFKDSSYLVSLSKALVNHVKSKKLILLEDRIQLFFNPTPREDKVNELAKKMKAVFTKNTSKENLNKTVELYSKYPSILYKEAKKDAKESKNYPGADIWSFFKEDVGDYCISQCHRNILVIITDGYMYYDKTVKKRNNYTSYLTETSLRKLKLNKSTWENDIEKRKLGFIPIDKNFNNLEVLVLGIESHNKRNHYANDIIKNTGVIGLMQ